MKDAGEKVACLTAYDASFAAILDAAGVEVLLVGDSLGMVLHGQDTTLAVTMDDMIYHARLVARGRKRALLMVDLPFMSFATPERALENAARLMREGSAHMVKLEGGVAQVEIVQELSRRGIPVCAHLGLRPQSVHKVGGYRVHGREKADAEAMLDDARSLERAGADVLLLECVPSALAGQIARTVDVPVIGIGAGPDCDGQILVVYDMLGITPGKRLRFSKDFLSDAASIHAAVRTYVSAVKKGDFPAPEHSFQ